MSRFVKALDQFYQFLSKKVEQSIEQFNGECDRIRILINYNYRIKGYKIHNLLYGKYIDRWINREKLPSNPFRTLQSALHKKGLWLVDLSNHHISSIPHIYLYRSEPKKKGLWHQLDHIEFSKPIIIDKSMLRLSKGVGALSIEVVERYVRRCYYEYRVPIISVGSGNGAVEQYIERVNPEIPIICVDPKPYSYLKYVYRNPDYAYTTELVNSNPYFVGNCILFLNWCNPNDSDYDMRAVEMLKPLAIICIIETWNGGNGAAGGREFHQFIRDPESSYNQVAKTGLLGCSLDITIEWFQQCGLPYVDVDICFDDYVDVTEYPNCCIC